MLDFVSIVVSSPGLCRSFIRLSDIPSPILSCLSLHCSYGNINFVPFWKPNITTKSAGYHSQLGPLTVWHCGVKRTIDSPAARAGLHRRSQNTRLVQNVWQNADNKNNIERAKRLCVHAPAEDLLGPPSALSDSFLRPYCLAHTQNVQSSIIVDTPVSSSFHTTGSKQEAHWNTEKSSLYHIS